MFRKKSLKYMFYYILILLPFISYATEVEQFSEVNLTHCRCGKLIKDHHNLSPEVFQLYETILGSSSLKKADEKAPGESQFFDHIPHLQSLYAYDSYAYDSYDKFPDFNLLDSGGEKYPDSTQPLDEPSNVQAVKRRSSSFKLGENKRFSAFTQYVPGKSSLLKKK